MLKGRLKNFIIIIDKIMSIALALSMFIINV